MGNVCIATILNKLLSSSETIQCEIEHSNCCSTIIEASSSSSSSTPRKGIDTESVSSFFKSIDTEIK